MSPPTPPPPPGSGGPSRPGGSSIPPPSAPAQAAFDSYVEYDPEPTSINQVPQTPQPGTMQPTPAPVHGHGGHPGHPGHGHLATQIGTMAPAPPAHVAGGVVSGTINAQPFINRSRINSAGGISSRSFDSGFDTSASVTNCAPATCPAA